MSITSTTITSYDFLLRQCYSSNRNARKAIGRSALTADDLVRADSDALKKVSRNLKDMEYSTDNGVNIYNNVKAFVEAYNNLYDSSGKLTSSSDLTRAEKKLKNFVKENKDSLEEIGIKVSSSGKLTIKKDTLLTTKPSKVSKVLSASNEFTGTVAKYATKINRIAKNLMRIGNTKTKKTDETTPGTGTGTDLPVTTPTMPANSIDFLA